MIVFFDNVSVMYLSSHHIQYQFTKHVEIDLHFVREHVAIGHVHVLHVASAHQFTKGLPTQLFLNFHDNLNIGKPYAQTEGCVKLYVYFIHFV